jgi:ADP-ribose pyrophosphatase YjhB (NUDIX family)
MGYLEELRALLGSQLLITIGVSVVVLRGREVLLEKRHDSRDWGLPGGYKELGETLEETACRELFEETGLGTRGLRFLSLCSGPEFTYTYPNGDCIEPVTAVYQALEVEGDLRTSEGENLELRYFDVLELPTMHLLSERLLWRALEVLANWPSQDAAPGQLDSEVGRRISVPGHIDN